MDWMGGVAVNKRGAEPVYRQVAGALRSAILGGRLAAGAAVGEERVLAARLGLSRMTVRKAITTVVAEGLVERVRGRGSFVAARTAETNGAHGATGTVREGAEAGVRRRSIAIVAPFSQGDLVARQFYYRIFQGMQQGVAEAASASASGGGGGEGSQRTELVFRTIGEPVGAWVSALNAAAEIDAVAILGVADPRLLAGLAALEKPVVLIDSAWSPGGRPVDKVRLENLVSCRSAVAHLIQLGHRAIGLLNFVPDTAAARQRREAYLGALQAQGLTPPAGGVVAVELTGTAAYAAMRPVLAARRSPSSPTAWFCASDELAVGLMAAAKDSGLKIPADLSVVGFGDLGHFTWPPLSSVRIPIEEMGRRAVGLCLRRWADPAAAVQEVVVPGELVVRGSSAPVGRGEDKDEG